MNNANNDLPKYASAFDVKCPYCGRAEGTFGRNDYRYGSPIRVCKKCGNKYVNPFYHEIAIDGVAPSAFNIKSKVKAIAVLAVLFAAALLFHIYELNCSRYYHTAPVVIMIVAPLCILFSIGDIIYTKSGAKARRTQQKFNESAERLRDKEYVKELIAHGYDVPERYRDGLDETDIQEAFQKGQNV